MKDGQLPQTPFSQKKKQELDAYLLSALSEYQTNYQQVKIADDVFVYLRTFLVSGKSVRGLLILELLELMGKGNDPDFLAIAAAVELVHAGLLIQDDFMDNDQQRRGMPSLYYTYQTQAKQQQLSNQELYGISLATCVGDLCFFMAFDQLAKLKKHKALATDITGFLSQEYMVVGFAQMRDTHLGYVDDIKDISEIIDVYRGKTARYTFSMPLGLAGRMAELPPRTIQLLEQIGEEIGIVFQIRDDYISLFSATKTSGKPIGSDVAENKKTLYRHLLLEAIHNSKDTRYAAIPKLFGNKKISNQEIKLIQTAIIELGVEAQISELSETHFQKLEQLIGEIQLSQPITNFLKQVANFVHTRIH